MEATEGDSMTAIDSKDTILSLLRNSEGDEIVGAVEKICHSLQLTAGLWHELSYAYKAREILDICANRIGELIWANNNWKREVALRGTLNKVWEARSLFL